MGASKGSKPEALLASLSASLSSQLSPLSSESSSAAVKSYVVTKLKIYLHTQLAAQAQKYGLKCRLELEPLSPVAFGAESAERSEDRKFIK